MVGFGDIGVVVALSTGSGFDLPQFWIKDFGSAAGAGEWRADNHPRVVADVNGDGKADVVGFGNMGVLVALSAGASFDRPQLWIKDFGYDNDAGGWEVDKHPRVVADVNGDGRADVVGFGDAGALVSLSTGSRFDKPQLWIKDFGYDNDAGGWEVDKHPRVVADVNGDGAADVVGFGNTGVLVALSTGSRFDKPRPWIEDFAYNAREWEVDKHPRVVADVNGDGRADVIGFGNTGVLVALSTGASFDTPQLWIEDYGYNRDAGAWLIEKHPRGVADVNGDGRADVVGFDDIGVAVALSTGASFDKSQLWIEEFGYSAGYWR